MRFDLFPMTEHVELVAALECATSVTLKGSATRPSRDLDVGGVGKVGSSGMSARLLRLLRPCRPSVAVTLSALS